MPNPADTSSLTTGLEDTPHPPLVPPALAAPLGGPAEHATPLLASKSGRRAFLGLMPLALVSATRVRQPVSSFAPAPVPGLYFDGRQAYPSGYHPVYLQRIVHYANALTHMPYKFGGGHASLVDNGYDCSGALSYVFCGAGFLSRPMISGEFAHFGQPGAGIYLTIYVRPGVHVFMTVCGLRFDTSDGQGPRWHTAPRNHEGYLPRRILGL